MSGNERLLPGGSYRQPPPRRQTTMATLSFILPVVIVSAFILAGMIYGLAYRNNDSRLTSTSMTTSATTTYNPHTTTTTTVTYTIPTTTTTTATPTTTTNTGSYCNNDADCPPGQSCINNSCQFTTTAPPTTTTTTTTFTTATTTTITVTNPPTTTPLPSCQTCSQSIQNTICSVQLAACNANTYNCPVLCYGTFMLDGAIPATCFNGAIPQWPDLSSCICGNGCFASCAVNCDTTLPTTTPGPTPPPVVCQNCFNAATGVGGACRTEYLACISNPTSNCALLCAPYYGSNLPIPSACTNAMLVPQWNPLATCLCPLCGNNVTCTANQC